MGKIMKGKRIVLGGICGAIASTLAVKIPDFFTQMVAFIVGGGIGILVVLLIGTPSRWYYIIGLTSLSGVLTGLIMEIVLRGMN